MDVAMSTRIQAKFSELKDAGRPGLVTFITGGDPNFDASLAVLKSLPGAGADIIEVGMAFSDPMAEGIPIQLSSQRALQAGMTLERTLDLVRAFRQEDQTTPIVLMGYYNPIYRYGSDAFVKSALDAGADGLIVVDLPAEADEELCVPALEAGMNFIRLATPTTDDRRLPTILKNTSGFVYYVSVTGITGAALTNVIGVGEAVARIKRHTDLPVAVGFGVKTREQAEEIGKFADGVVVGSAIVNAIRDSLDETGQATDETVPAVTRLVESLAQGVRAARA